MSHSSLQINDPPQVSWETPLGQCHHGSGWQQGKIQKKAPVTYIDTLCVIRSWGTITSWPGYSRAQSSGHQSNQQNWSCHLRENINANPAFMLAQTKGFSMFVDPWSSWADLNKRNCGNHNKADVAARFMWFSTVFKKLFDGKSPAKNAAGQTRCSWLTALFPPLTIMNH